MERDCPWAKEHKVLGDTGYRIPEAHPWASLFPARGDLVFISRTAMCRESALCTSTNVKPGPQGCCCQTPGDRFILLPTPGGHQKDYVKLLSRNTLSVGVNLGSTKKNLRILSKQPGPLHGKHPLARPGFGICHPLASVTKRLLAEEKG